MAQEKILISGCLLGEKVRYDGKAATVENNLLAQWQTEGRLVSVCPEVDGGLTIPRLPAEMSGSSNGKDVLMQIASIKRKDGADVTAAFLKGANHALAVAKKHNIKIAVLKDNSPSCASRMIYDGSFSGKKVPGQGVTAALLEENGIKVFSENELAAAESYLRSLEAAPPPPASPSLTSHIEIS